MVDIIHRIGITAPLAQVRQAVSTVAGIAGWWTRETTGDSTHDANVRVSFRDPRGAELGKMQFRVFAPEAESRVRWSFDAGPDEWLGTEVTFDLKQDGERTLIVFGHRNWREAVEFTAHCSMKWATFLLSLREFVETGTGKPAPNDLKIDDWN